MSSDITWTVIFYLCIALIWYTYAGYPLLVCIIGCFKPKKIQKSDHEPNVTILIAAYNEEESIESTIRNKLELNYPRDKFNIIVISDGSDDKTDEIVKSFKSKGVILLRQEPRAGKTAALNMAVSQAVGDILVFSDANSIYAHGALKKLVSNFADPEVGYVTGKMVYTNPDGTMIGDGCSAYMKYENFLRSAETRIGSVVGVDGGIDAIRKIAYRKMNPDQLPDFVLPLMVIEQGYRVVYEPNALLQEPSLKSFQDEYRMRVRVTLRAFWALFSMRQLLGCRHNRLFAWQLWSHKVLRYLCFVFLVIALVSNFLLISKDVVFQLFFLIQASCYFIAMFAPLLERKGFRFHLFTFSRYFLLLNMASGHAFLKFLLGRKQTLWTPRKG